MWNKAGVVYIEITLQFSCQGHHNIWKLMTTTTVLVKCTIRIIKDMIIYDALYTLLKSPLLNFFLQILNTVKSILEGYENFAHLIP